MDGHGGKTASLYTRDNLVRAVVEALEAGMAPEAALTHAFAKLEAEYEIKFSDPKCGTTCVVLLVELSTRNMWCANLGDSRAILCRPNQPAVAMSIDHKPDLPEEKDRIKQAGGLVFNRRLNGILAVSRAIGDTNYTGISHVPDVKMFTLDAKADGESYVVMGCDGLFDVFDNDEIGEFVADGLQRSNELVNYMGYRAENWKIKPIAKQNLKQCCCATQTTLNQMANLLVHYSISVKGSLDNVSVIIVQL
jgi:serine/threonine protein phosphatase PrpC